MATYVPHIPKQKIVCKHDIWIGKKIGHQRQGRKLSQRFLSFRSMMQMTPYNLNGWIVKQKQTHLLIQQKDGQYVNSVAHSRWNISGFSFDVENAGERICHR